MNADNKIIDGKAIADAMKKEIQVAVTDRGKLNLITYDLFKDDNGRLYFEYGVVLERIYLDNFAEVA